MDNPTRKTLEDSLHQVAKQRGYEDYTFEISPVSTGGGNYTSNLYHGKVSSSNNEDLNFFGKVATLGEVFRSQMPTSIYDVEHMVYSKLVKLFETLQNEYNVPEEKRFRVPEIYWYSDNYLKEVLLIEDLANQGFDTYSRFESVTWQYASKAMEELSKFHALNLAVETHYPEEYKEITKNITVTERSESQMALIKQMLAKGLELIKDDNRARVTDYINQSIDKIILMIYGSIRRPILVHGDFKVSNIMHKNDEEENHELVIIDYQTIHIGCVAKDLLFFIFTGSDGEFRKKYYPQLLDHYYEHLRQSMARFNLDPNKVYPKDDFNYEIKESLIIGLVFALIALPVTTVDEKDAPVLDGDMGKLSNIKTSELCYQRINDIVDDFIRWGVVPTKQPTKDQEDKGVPKLKDMRDLALQNTLNEIANQRHYDDYKLEITPIEADGTNYSSRLYSGKIVVPGEPDIKWFGKVAIINETVREDMPVDIYQLEQYFYKTILRNFDALENKYNVPEQYRLRKPKFYGCSAVRPYDVIILEDLAAEGYSLHDRRQSFQWDYASAVTQQLATFHALSLGLQHHYPEEYAKIHKMVEGNGVTESLANTIAVTLNKNISLINEKHRDRVTKYLENIMETAPKLREPCKRAVLGHGDFKGSNVMYKLDEVGNHLSIIIDYQTMHIGSALNDLLYFIFTGSDSQFRRKDYQRLIDHYYDQLCLALSRLDMNPEKVFPREDFDYEHKEYLKHGLLLAILALPMMCVEGNDAPDLDDHLELDKVLQVKPSTLSVERLNGVVENFIEWGLL